GIGMTLAILDVNFFSILPAELLEALLKYNYALANIGIAFSDRHQNAKAPHPIGLLCPCGEWPRCHCAAQKCDELAPLHVSPQGPRLMRGLKASTLRPRCPLWVKSRHMQCKRSCPLYPQKRTCALQLEMSALGQKRTSIVVVIRAGCPEACH